MPRKDYGLKQVHNCTTGEITYVELTDEEVAEYDTRRAAAEAEPAPKSELEQLRELTTTLLKRVEELEKRK